MSAIWTSGLTKVYRGTTVVDHIDLEVHAGDRYGFLGPNGSGKTTTVRLLLGLVFATSGEIELLGERVPRHVHQVLPKIGALVEGPAFPGHLAGRTGLALIDAAGADAPSRTRRKRINEALERVGLAGVGRKPVKAYSLGMRQRLGLAAALLRQPELLVLDEPTNGLDPQGIREVRDLLFELNERGTTIFMSSHQLAEVEALCNRVGVVDRGRLVLQGEPELLRTPTGHVIVRTNDVDRAIALLDGRVASREGDTLRVRSDDPIWVNQVLVREGIRVQELQLERHSLEDVVLGVTTTTSDRADK
jgi:ABC-2 type transport system ATP-binding protein